MKIALLGYGKEGKSLESYFKSHDENLICDIFDNFTYDEIKQRDYSSYDIIFRSPSVPPLHTENESSVTKYFFDHCPCTIIGVTGTKGKGTTCSMINAVLQALGVETHLVGNIGLPAIDVLDDLGLHDVVVYEMSSFQLWDLEKSPKIAVVLRIEPDHLNVHRDFDDYIDAKSHITKYQSTSDHLVYFKNNPNSAKIAKQSKALKYPYPLDNPPEVLTTLLDSLNVPGDHNRENAEAALIACSAYYNVPFEEFLATNFDKIKAAFKSFKGLPHHLEFVRTINGVDYYDDSFSASSPSLDVAIKAFPNHPIVLIAGGKDRGLDLTPHKKAIFSSNNVKKAILIGETKDKLSADESSDKYQLCSNFKEAILAAKACAESLKDSSPNRPIVLLSPGAASFDMFKDFYDRGDQFQAIVRSF